MDQLKPFKSDGCTLFPDADWGGCCVQHDRAYHRGGTAADRLGSDIRMVVCVAARGRPWVALLMFLGVRLFGVPWLPVPWRWGFGRPYAKSWRYDPAEPSPDPDTKKPRQ